MRPMRYGLTQVLDPVLHSYPSVCSYIVNYSCLIKLIINFKQYSTINQRQRTNDDSYKGIIVFLLSPMIKILLYLFATITNNSSLLSCLLLLPLPIRRHPAILLDSNSSSSIISNSSGGGVGKPFAEPISHRFWPFWGPWTINFAF